MNNEDFFAPTMIDVMRATEFLGLDKVGRFYTEQEHSQIMRLANDFSRKKKRG